DVRSVDFAPELSIYLALELLDKFLIIVHEETICITIEDAESEALRQGYRAVDRLSSQSSGCFRDLFRIPTSAGPARVTVDCVCHDFDGFLTGLEQRIPRIALGCALELGLSRLAGFDEFGENYSVEP